MTKKLVYDYINIPRVYESEKYVNYHLPRCIKCGDREKALLDAIKGRLMELAPVRHRFIPKSAYYDPNLSTPSALWGRKGDTLLAQLQRELLICSGTHLYCPVCRNNVTDQFSHFLKEHHKGKSIGQKLTFHIVGESSFPDFVSCSNCGYQGILIQAQGLSMYLQYNDISSLEGTPMYEHGKYLASYGVGQKRFPQPSDEAGRGVFPGQPPLVQSQPPPTQPSNITFKTRCWNCGHVMELFQGTKSFHCPRCLAEGEV